MKKVLLAILIVFVATTVWAGSSVDPTDTTKRVLREREYQVIGTPQVKFDLSGEFSAQGYYWDNYALASDDTVTNTFYKGYLSLFPKLTVGDTTVFMKVNMRDEVWGDVSHYSGQEDSDVWPYMVSDDSNDNINIELAYMSHKFASTETLLDLGLMQGQWWATTFGDKMEPRYRVKVVQNTPVGPVIAILEKNAELGDPDVEDSEKDDGDTYHLAMITKLGTVYVKPLITYYDRSSKLEDQGSDGVQVLQYSLGLDGTLGPIEFESEFNYRITGFEDLKDYTAANPLYAYAKDAKYLGAYVNVFKTMDFGKPGIVLVYLGYDDEGGPVGSGHGLDSRQDFKANLIIGDEIGFGSVVGQDAEDLLGMNMIKPYIQGMKAMDNLTFDASFAYIMSNQDAYSAAVTYYMGANPYEDATAMEVDLGLNVKVTPNLYYMVDAGYANIDFDDVDDPDPVMLLKHEMLFTF